MGTSQKRAIRKYRSGLSQRGMARFEVLGRDGDQELIRKVARRLSEEGPDATKLRAAVTQAIGAGRLESGGIVAALRRSPLVGADLEVARSRQRGRKVNL